MGQRTQILTLIGEIFRWSFPFENYNFNENFNRLGSIGINWDPNGTHPILTVYLR